jgi:hypothetical protein
MPSILKLTVENPDEIRNVGAYDTAALMRVQSSADNVTFADLVGSGSTPTVPVVALTRAYTGYDPAGTSSTWYRTRFENGAGTRLSDWSASFQTGEPSSGLCSIYDVKQRILPAASQTIVTTDDEMLLDFIAETTSEIRAFTGQMFVPDPVSGAATVRLYDGFDSRNGLILPIAGGIRAVTTLEVAQFTGGTFATVPSGQFFLRPRAFELIAGWPFRRIELTNYPTSANTRPFFFDGYENIRIAGAFDWAAVPFDVQGIATNVVIKKYQARGSGVATAAGSDAFGARLLRWLSPEEQGRLTRYALDPIAVG